MRQPTIHQMREKKNHGGKVKEVERLQYDIPDIPKKFSKTMIYLKFKVSRFLFLSV
jgi:hypothetical protein